MKIKKIFEDKYLLVVEKPAGMVVNISATTKNMKTLQDWLVKNGLGDGVERNGIVHRIDKETSGALIIAKTEQVMKDLQKQFKDRKVSKEYLTLVHGEVKPATGKIKVPVTRNPFNRTKFGVFVGGKSAETGYQAIGVYKKGQEKFSLLKVKPKTGRTHQIRVHMKYINHPVVADNLYAGRKTNKKDRLWCVRLFLHAHVLEVIHPVLNKKMSFEAKLATDLQTVLKKLEKLDGRL